MVIFVYMIFLYHYLIFHSCRYQRDGSEEIATSIKKSRDLDFAITTANFYRCNRKVCQMIIESIQRYFSRQIMEPSFHKSLTLIDRSLPNRNLYLLELLQNAVDEGAMLTIFQLKVIDLILESII